MHEFSLKLHPRNIDGSFITNFQPIGEAFNTIGFCESNSAIYTNYVPHDLAGLIELFGGRDKYTEFLDSSFIKAKPNRFECEVFLPALVASSARGQIPRDLNLRIVGASFPGKNIRTTTDENIYGPSYEVAQGLTYGEEVTLEFLLKQNHEESINSALSTTVSGLWAKEKRGSLF